MSETNTIEAEDEIAPLQPEDVLVVPSEYFFTETIEVPPALDPSELDDFAELSMEANAPFPLEHLYWGFLTGTDGKDILIYAALKDRLKRAGFKNLESYTWVLPDFATLAGARFADAMDIVLRGDVFDTHLRHPGGEAFVQEIHSQPSGTQPAERDALVLTATSTELTEKGLPIFHFEAESEAPSSGHWSPLEPEESSLWRADIRPMDFKNVERSSRRTGALIARLTGYAAIFALFLIFIEGGLFLGEFWLGTREAKVESQAMPVRRIEDKQSLMNKLDQVAQNELRPIAILTGANDIRINLGSAGIEYKEAVIDEGNRLTLEGKSKTITQLNAYTEALRNSGNFELVSPHKSNTVKGVTSFMVVLDYTHTEAPVIEDEAPEIAEDSSTIPSEDQSEEDIP